MHQLSFFLSLPEEQVDKIFLKYLTSQTIYFVKTK